MFDWLLNRNKKRVFVGLSGGVDSSVTAALLKKEGYEVVGCFIRTWYPEWLSERCTWRDDRRDAMRVAAHLDIPFIEVDLCQEYKEGVADVMIREYQAGRTPNPDVLCNEVVKFGAFFRWAMERGADVVATGHYAQIKKGKHPTLIRGRDNKKDQSYFLWKLGTEQLSKTLFPVGEFTKQRVRVMAQTFGLPTAEKKDSQGICFLGAIDLEEFLGHYIDLVAGDVLDESGHVIGRHKGSVVYTIGQRHGFTLEKQGNNNTPLYVVAKDIHANTITVAPKHEPIKGEPLHENHYILSECVLHPSWKTHEKKLGCQIRYQGLVLSCCIEHHVPEKNEVTIVIESDEEVALGQSVVFYAGNQCLGGGIVKEKAEKS